MATGEFIVPFEDLTLEHVIHNFCDSDSNYFIQYLDGFYPDRVYKIQLKLKYDDGQEQVFDEDFEFIVKTSTDGPLIAIVVEDFAATLGLGIALFGSVMMLHLN